MKVLISAALIVFSSLAGLTYAQGAAQRGQTDITQPTPIVLENLTETQPTICLLPDGSGYALNTTTTYDGQRYRCVEVFAPTDLLTLRSDADGKTRTFRSPGTLKVRMAG